MHRVLTNFKLTQGYVGGYPRTSLTLHGPHNIENLSFDLHQPLEMVDKRKS